jgi:hypothetical protein
MLGSGTAKGVTNDVTVTIAQHAAGIAGDPGGFLMDVHETNNDSTAINQTMTLTLQLPSGVTADPSANCTSPGSGGAGTVDCPLNLALAANDSSTQQIELQADHTSAGTTNGLASSATSSGLTFDAIPNYSIEVDGRADLVPSISAAAGSHVAGDPAGFDYTVKVKNNGFSDNTGGYVLTGTLPAGQSFDPSGGCSGSGTSFTCMSSSGIVAGATDTYTVHVKVASSASPGTPSATASVASSGTTDPTPPPADDASTTATIITQADLVPSISAAAGSHVAGDPAGFDYTVKVKNNGFSDNTGGYTVTGTLASGVTFASGTAGCAAATGGFTCTNSTGIVAGATDAYTVHVNVASSACPGTAPSCDATVSAGASVASLGTTDPNPPPGDDATGDASIITRADLQPSITVPGTTHIAGDPSGFDYTVKVKDGGFSDNHGGYTVAGSFPAGISFASGPAACSATTGGYSCTTASGLTSGSTDTYVIHVTAASSTCLGSPSAVPACNGFANATASAASNGTTDPVQPPTDDATASTTINTEADLSAISMSASNSLLQANTAPANTETFTYQLTNNIRPATSSFSDAQHVTVSLPDHPGSAGNPSFFIIDGVCRVGTTDCTHPGDFGPSTDIGSVTSGAAVTVVINAHANPLLGHAPPLSIISGPFTFTNTATVASPTDDPGTGTNVKSNLSPNVTIETVPSPPQNVLASPGNTNVVVSWKAPAKNGNQSNSLDSTNPYQLIVKNGTTIVRTIDIPTSAAQPCLSQSSGVCYNVTTLNNGTKYTFEVRARNNVGLSDPGTDSTTPTVNASATIVPPATAQTLTTCKVATATQTPCIQYIIPSGSGGVANIQGNLSPTLPQIAPLCAQVTGGCTGNVAFDLISSAYDARDINHPILEIVTWDATQAGAGLKSVIWDQSAELNGGVPFVLPKCTNGGVAKPDPCLKSLNILGSKNNPDKNAQGDLQAQINLTSDVDTIPMKH